MKNTPLQRLDLWARALSPFAIPVLLILASVALVRSPEVAPVVPSLAMTAVFYWSVFRPDLLPPWAIFLLGLFQDLITGIPVGAGVLALLIVYFSVAAQRRFFSSASFFMLWVSFILIAAVASLPMWLAASFLLGRFVDPAPVLLQYLATIAVYPCLAWLFGQAQQAFLRTA